MRVSTCRISAKVSKLLRETAAKLQARRQTFARIFVISIAGSLFIAGTVTAIAPRMWGLLNAHTQVPPSLTNFSGLAQRSSVFDATGKQIGTYQLENSQMMSIDAVPTDDFDQRLDLIVTEAGPRWFA